MSSLLVAHCNLLGRNLEGGGPHVDLLVHIHAGEDEEHPRTPGAARQQPAQPEDNCPFILLNNLLCKSNIKIRIYKTTKKTSILDGEEKRQGERDYDEDGGGEDDEDRATVCTLVTICQDVTT